MKNKISIITVVYNDEKHIEATIKSIIKQTYELIEYLVIDGGSSDGTVPIIQKYLPYISTFISEKDGGIYDAMNKGINRCTGDWVIFINSGDILYGNTTIEEAIVELENLQECSIVYGDVLVDLPEHDAVYCLTSKQIEEIHSGMVMNHQSCFIRTELHRKWPYNLNYKIASDYDFVMKCFYKGTKIKKINLIIAKILAGGLSDTKRCDTFAEFLKIQNNYYPSFKNYYRYFISVAYFFIATIVKKIIRQKALSSFYKKKYKILLRTP